MAARFLEVQEILSDGSKLPVMINLDHIIQIYQWPADEVPPENARTQITTTDGEALDVAETYDQIRQALGVANIG